MQEFSQEELQRAADRVREMSRRANLSGGRHTRPPMPDFVSTRVGETPQNTVPNIMQNDMQKAHTKPNAINSLFKMINFKNLEIDGDVSLILGILLLLSGETYDELLSLALLYRMM